nr:hypothetical protein [Serratia fonticola]
MAFEFAPSATLLSNVDDALAPMATLLAVVVLAEAPRAREDSPAAEDDVPAAKLLVDVDLARYPMAPAPTALASELTPSATVLLALALDSPPMDKAFCPPEELEDSPIAREPVPVTRLKPPIAIDELLVKPTSVDDAVAPEPIAIPPAAEALALTPLELLTERIILPLVVSDTVATAKAFPQQQRDSKIISPIKRLNFCLLKENAGDKNTRWEVAKLVDIDIVYLPLITAQKNKGLTPCYQRDGSQLSDAIFE